MSDEKAPVDRLPKQLSSGQPIPADRGVLMDLLGLHEEKLEASKAREAEKKAEVRAAQMASESAYRVMDRVRDDVNSLRAVLRWKLGEVQ